jgi:hypothetical protein
VTKLVACSEFLSRLDGVRRVGDGRWIARCPAHDDHDPSLSIKETDSGVVLAHCHAGCAFGDVIAAVGLRVSDLMPDLPKNFHSKPLAKRNLERLRHLSRIEIILSDVAKGAPWAPDMIRDLRESQAWLAQHPQTEDWR